MVQIQYHEQFVLHVSMTNSTANKKGLIEALDNAKNAHDSRKGKWKAVLYELANYPLSTAKTEQKTAESLLLKAEVGNLTTS